MKKNKVLFIVLLFVFLLWGCGTSDEAENVAGSDQAETENFASSDLPEVEIVDSDQTGEMSPEDTGGNESIEEKADGNDHTHHPAEENNIVAHEQEGYCGNTITTIQCHLEDGGNWEKSFWGDDSVVLTDLLLYLDYKDDICTCMPEYTVDTEFGEEYGISLAESYARHGDRQTALTEEQVEEIREIIERVSEQPDTQALGMNEICLFML